MTEVFLCMDLSRPPRCHLNIGVLAVMGTVYCIMLSTSVGLLRYLPVPFFFIAAMLTGESIVPVFFCMMPYSFPDVNAIILTGIVLITSCIRGGFRISSRTPVYLMAGIMIWTAVIGWFAPYKRHVVNEIITWGFILILWNLCQTMSRRVILSSLKGLLIGWSVLAVLQIPAILTTGFIEEKEYAAIRLPTVNYRALAFGSMILLVEYLTAQKELQRLLGILLQVVFFVNIVTLASRGMTMLILVYFFAKVILVGWKKSASFSRRTILTLLVVTGVVLFLLSPASEKVVETIQSISDSRFNNTRIVLYGDIIKKMIPDHFWIGIGPGNFQLVYPRYASTTFHADHAHSIYLQMLVESGFVGFALLTTMCLRDLLRMTKHLFSSVITYSRLCAYIVAYFLIYGLVENVWGDSRSMALYFIFIGLYDRIGTEGLQCWI